jgi:MATE family multidrug resistance protein
MWATIVANVVNAVLDYGLIFGKLGLPEMGVAGAGIATAIAQWVYAVYMIVAFRRQAIRTKYATDRVPPNRNQMKRLVWTGAPIGGQWVLGMLSFAVFSTIIARMGDNSAAASQAFIVLLSVSFMQAIGISIASSTLVGRYIGAGDLPSARKSFRSSLKLAAILGGLIAVLFVAAPELLLRIFTDDPSVLQLGYSLVFMGALFQFFDCFGIVADGSLRGAGDTRWPFLVHAMFAWGLFVPLSYLFGVTLDGGVFGAWVGGTIYVIVLAGVFVLRFVRGAWEQIEI